MKYLWTEDAGAGLHFWQLVNQYLYGGTLIVESKGSNQGLVDAVRELVPKSDDIYYLAFDKVYDNMDIVNKLLELQSLAERYPEQIILLDITCFEEIILAFKYLIEWTDTGRRDKVAIREHLLNALNDHRIDIERIEDKKTLNYLMGFKRFSTERVLKSITNELTDMNEWSVKGTKMGDCWYKDCCSIPDAERVHCGLRSMPGKKKILTLLQDRETQRIIKDI